VISMNLPNVSILDDLTITEIEDGFQFSAPDGTQCAAWLSYYNSTDELREEFSELIISALKTRLEEIEGQHGDEI
jgi:hypothetical protein